MKNVVNSCQHIHISLGSTIKLKLFSQINDIKSTNHTFRVNIYITRELSERLVNYVCFIEAGLCIIDQQGSAKFNYLNEACVCRYSYWVCTCVCMLPCVYRLLPSAEWVSHSACSRSRFLGLTASNAQSQQSCRAQRERGEHLTGRALLHASINPWNVARDQGAHAHSCISLSSSVFATLLQKLLLFIYNLFELLLNGSLYLFIFFQLKILQP